MLTKFLTKKTSGGGKIKFVDFSSIVVIIVTTMKYEWDEKKNRENIRKHGLDFAGAWQVFQNPLFVKPDERDDYGEDRWIGIGMMGSSLFFFSPKSNMKRHALSP